MCYICLGEIQFVWNRTRNEHFACVEQAAKLIFAAVVLTTAVKLKVILIFVIYYHNYNIHIYLHICGVIVQNLDWLQLKFDLCQFLCQELLLWTFTNKDIFCRTVTSLRKRILRPMEQQGW
jgi:hypothetical protein